MVLTEYEIDRLKEYCKNPSFHHKVTSIEDLIETVEFVKNQKFSEEELKTIRSLLKHRDYKDFTNLTYKSILNKIEIYLSK